MDQFTLYCNGGRQFTGVKIGGRSWSIRYDSGIEFNYRFELGNDKLVILMVALVSPTDLQRLSIATNMLLEKGVQSEHLPFWGD